MSHAAYLYGIVAIMILAFMVGTSCQAASWSTQVQAGGDYLRLSRSSETLTMFMQGTVSGSITPVEVTPSGRTVKSDTSSYSSINVNDVGSTETVSAGEGRIIKNGNTFLFSNDQADFYRNTTVSGDTALIEINEQWPTILQSWDQIRYKGTGLNNFENMENTYDRIGESSLYNKNYDKELSIRASLTHFNATITATDYGLTAELLPTTNTDYKLSLNSSGITDLYQKILSPEYDPKHQTYPPSVQDYERYEGTFSIQRNITKTSSNARYQQHNRWPCLCQVLQVTPWDVTKRPPYVSG
jgi:hypothetical protein